MLLIAQLNERRDIVSDNSSQPMTEVVLRLLQASSCFRGEVCPVLPCACAETLAATPTARIAELEAALRFYADGRRYRGANQQPIPDDPYAKPDAVYILDVTRDGGAIANTALKGAS
jgi:hypothetical protein